MTLLSVLHKWCRSKPEPTAALQVSSGRVHAESANLKLVVSEAERKGTLNKLRDAINEAASKDVKRMRGE